MMSLGYALLHRSRIEVALGASNQKRTYDETFDIAFGSLGAGDPGPGFREFLETRSRSVQEWVERLTGAGAAGEGPFAALRRLFEGDLPGVGDLPGLLSRLETLFANPGALRETLSGLLNGVVDALPDLSGAALMDLVRGQVEDLTLILERRYRDGQRDAAAQRAFRAAVTIRQWIGGKLDAAAEEGPLDFDVRALLRGMIDSLVAQLGGAGFDRISGAIRGFQAQFGGLFRAMGSFEFSASASASASGGAGGPQGMADEPTFADDRKAAPHPVGHALWVLDLITNIFATFNSIWELVRTRAFSGRAFDGVLSVLMMLWQVTHSVMRSAFAGHVNLQSATDEHAGRKVLNWFFTDQANLSLNLFHRLLGSLVYETGGKFGASDWALSIAQRMLKFYTNVVNVRIYYWFFRSWWYFRDWATRGSEAERTARASESVSLNRTIWAVWGPWYFLSSIGGLIPAWENFTLEKGLGEPRTWVPLLVFGLLGVVGGYLALGFLSGHNPFTLTVGVDWGTFILIAVMTLIGVIALCIIVDNLESESKGGAWAGVGVLIAILVIGIACLAITFGTGTTGAFNSFALFWQLFFCGLLPACVLPFILWWYYIDDSRDKLGLFEGKDPETSPYLLPFPKDENWICGQGVHGIFSHYPVDPAGGDSDNHYAYDFNEAQDKSTFAARAGIVVNLVEDRDNDGQEANFVDIQHLDWVAGHDPGDTNEAVLTRATYFHLSKNRIWADFNHLFSQGYHLADIDNTGRSALNHLHYHVEDTQRGRFLVYPTIFKDESLRGFRNYPLLAWIPGKGHIPGKPITMAYYVSDNEERPVLRNPVMVMTAAGGTPPHMHLLILDRRTITTATIPTSVTLFTTVAEGHYHSITLDGDAVRRLLGLRDLTGLVVDTANGHSHTLLSHTRNGGISRLLSTTDGNNAHGHQIDLSREPFWTDVWPASTTLTTDSVDDDGDGPRAAHTHALTVTRDQLMQLFSRDLGSFTLPTGTGTADHTHRLRTVNAVGPGSPAVTPVNPPAAQLLAGRAGPYNLVGEQLVVRIDDRATEYFFYGARRPALLADIALDRGLAASDALIVGGTSYSLDPSTVDRSARGTARLLGERIASGAGGTTAIPVAILSLPVLVIESVRRGRTASLEATPAGTAPLFANGQARRGIGTGVFDDLGQVAPADLVTHVETILRNGWPAAPGGFSASVTGGRLRLEQSGGAVDLSASAARLGQVLAPLYDAASGVRTLRATGPMPLSTGRIDFGAPAHHQVPILGTPAVVQIDTTDPVFAGTALIGTPLVVTVLGVDQSIVLASTDGSATTIARRIAFEVEGVRTRVVGSTVVVETVAAGSGATLRLRKDTLDRSGAGVSPTLAGGTSIADTNAIGPSALLEVIQDANGRATPAYDAVAAAPSARLDGGRLVIEVAASHTIELVAVVLAGGTDPFAFTRPADTRLESQVLGGSVNLGGGGWIDLRIDGQPARIPLDGEIARLDLGPFDRLPVRDETLVIAVGGAGSVTVTFGDQVRSVHDVAAAIAGASDQWTVRVAYRWSVENALYLNPAHALALAEASGLAAAGFLRDRAGLTATSRGVGADEIAVPSNLQSPPFRDAGGPVRGLTVNEQVSGSNLVFEIAAPTSFQVAATADPTPDFLGLSLGPAATISTTALAETVPLGSDSQQYVLELREAGGTVRATSRVQINAAPAILRTTRAAFLPVTATSPVVNLTIIEPQSGSGTIERRHVVDLTGVGSLAEAAQRFGAAVPGLRAWSVVRPSDSVLVMHLETLGKGTGWELRLDNAPMLAALGFGLSHDEQSANGIRATGRGDVRDGRGVTRDEIRAAFRRVQDCLTGLVAVSGSPATAAPRRLQVATVGNTLQLSSLEGPVTVETNPPGLRAALNVTESPALTTLALGATVPLDNGDVVIKAAGRTLAVASVWGDHASIRADRPLPDPTSADGVAMLDLLKLHPIRLRVNLTPTTLAPVPAAVANFEEALEFLAGQVPGAWLGIVGGHVVIETRGRGNSRRIQIDFSQFSSLTTYPVFTLLGFEGTQLTAVASRSNWQVNGSGRGSVGSLEPAASVGSVGSFESLVRRAARIGAAPQAVFDVEVDSAVVPSVLRVRTNAETDRLEQPTPLPTVGPGAVPFNPPAGGTPPNRVLEAAYSGAPALEPEVFELRVENAAGIERSVTALFAGQPARLPSLQLPANRAILNGRGFVLTTSDGTARTIVFASDAATTPDQLAAQIERQAAWKVRAAVDGDVLRLETVETGSAVTLSLSAPGGAISNAITGDPATGIVAPRALPIQETGLGSVPNLAAVSAADFQQVVLHGFVSEAEADESGERDAPAVNRQAYEVPPMPIPTHFRLRSRRGGCASAVTPVVLLAPSLALDTALERAPALGGSVALPAFGGTKNLSGTLHVQLNDNAGAEDLPAPVVVPVTFATGAYTAVDVARRIHLELSARGAGQAAAYADGTVVIETAVNGLAGTVRIPAPGTGASGPDQVLLRELLGSNTELFGRGWPGTGFAGPGGALRPGFRSRTGAAAAAAQWVFGNGTDSTAPINVAAGQTLADLQRAVDAALRSTSGGRIGICRVAPDETLHIEATGNTLTLQVNGMRIPVEVATRPGQTPQRQEEPAAGLRRTQETRTFRFMRDRNGNGVEAEFDDVGWVRMTARQADAVDANTGAITAEAGTPTNQVVFPSGRYWIAVRPDASKTRDYDASGEMVIAGAADPADSARFQVHRVRFWVNLDGSLILRSARTTGGDLLADVLLA